MRLRNKKSIKPTVIPTEAEESKPKTLQAMRDRFSIQWQRRQVGVTRNMLASETPFSLEQLDDAFERCGNWKSVASSCREAMLNNLSLDIVLTSNGFPSKETIAAIGIDFGKFDSISVETFFDESGKCLGVRPGTQIGKGSGPDNQKTIQDAKKFENVLILEKAKRFNQK